MKRFLKQTGKLQRKIHTKFQVECRNFISFFFRQSRRYIETRAGAVMVAVLEAKFGEEPFVLSHLVALFQLVLDLLARLLSQSGILEALLVYLQQGKENHLRM